MFRHRWIGRHPSGSWRFKKDEKVQNSHPEHGRVSVLGIGLKQWAVHKVLG